jgi:hypothetical protein
MLSRRIRAHMYQIAPNQRTSLRRSLDPIRMLAIARTDGCHGNTIMLDQPTAKALQSSLHQGTDNGIKLCWATRPENFGCCRGTGPGRGPKIVGIHLFGPQTSRSAQYMGSLSVGIQPRVATRIARVKRPPILGGKIQIPTRRQQHVIAHTGGLVHRSIRILPHVDDCCFGKVDTIWVVSPDRRGPESRGPFQNPVANQPRWLVSNLGRVHPTIE